MMIIMAIILMATTISCDKLNNEEIINPILNIENISNNDIYLSLTNKNNKIGMMKIESHQTLQTVIPVDTYNYFFFKLNENGEIEEISINEKIVLISNNTYNITYLK